MLAVSIVQHAVTVIMICGAQDAKKPMYLRTWKMLLINGLGMVHWPMDGLVAWTLSWFGHGCTGQWIDW